MKKKLTRKEKYQQAGVNLTAKKNHPLSNTWIPGLIVALLGFVIYSNSLNHDYVLDDYSIILENRITKQGVAAIPEIFKTSYRHGYYMTTDNLYRPVVKSMFALEWEAGNGKPALGHWINLIFYALTGFVLYKTLLKLTDGKVLLAFIVSCLYIAHPIHTEVVANIKSRDEILAFLFSLISLYYYISLVKKNKTMYFVLSGVFFLLALLSKESAITFIAVLPLAAYFFTSSKLKSLVLSLVPVIISTLVFLIIRASVLNGSEGQVVSIADNLLMAADSPLSKFATAVYILGLYLKLLIFPHPLVFDYSYNQIPILEITDYRFILSGLIYCGLLFYALLNFKRKSVIAFCILYYLITISVFSNIFITIGSSMAERFMYAPSLGFCMVVGWGLYKLIKDHEQLESKKFTDQLKYSKPVMFLFLSVTVLYSLKAISRNPVWKNNYSLYSNDVLLSPNSTRTHYYLGNFLVKPEAWEGKSSQEKNEILYRGISELQKSIDIYPHFSDAHLQMGVAYYKLNNLDSALICYNNAMKVNPNQATIYNNIGTVYFGKQQYNDALNYFLKAVNLDPGYAEALMNLGSTYGMLQQYDLALNNLFKSIKADPNLAQSYYFIGITYQLKGDATNANIYLEKAYQLNPQLRPG